MRRALSRGRRLAAFLAGCLGATPSAAEEPADGFKLSGSVRLRYEAIAGQARTGFDSDDALTNLRTQILADYGNGPVHFVAELYDSRAWGADPGTPLGTGEVNTLEPVQACMQIWPLQRPIPRP